MKIISASSLAISFLLFAFSIVAAFAKEPLLDLNGKEVLTNTNYYMESTLEYLGGGLTLTSGQNELCPLSVSLGPYNQADLGLPLSLSSVDGDTKVYAKTDLTIKFTSLPTDNQCPEQSAVWQIYNYVKSTNSYITANGIEGRYRFQFKKIEGQPYWYEILRCPQGCGSIEPLCTNVGLADQFSENGRTYRRLALNQDPFYIRFIKAEELADM